MDTFTLGYGQDGRAEAAALIKKAQQRPSRRDTLDTVFKNDNADRRSDVPTVVLVRKLHDMGPESNLEGSSSGGDGQFFRKSTGRKAKVAAIASAVDEALRKVGGFPSQSSNASDNIQMPDTGAGRVTQELAPSDKPTLFTGRNTSAVTGAKTPPQDDDVLAAIKKDLSKPKRYG